MKGEDILSTIFSNLEDCLYPCVVLELARIRKEVEETQKRVERHSGRVEDIEKRAQGVTKRMEEAARRLVGSSPTVVRTKVLTRPSCVQVETI